MKGASVESIRAAIAAEDLTSALDLWNGYTGALAAGGLTAASLAEAAGLIAWGRPVLLCARAHAQDRLRALHAAGVYGAPAARTSALVRTSF